MDELLLFLLRKGGNKTSLKYSTTEIANTLDMSQQNVSRKLILLENDGFISRTTDGISITKKGFGYLQTYYLELKAIFERKSEIIIKGLVSDGVGDGKYYLGLTGYKNGIKEKLGFTPFPGTLNLKLNKSEVEKRLQLRAIDPITVPGFKEGEKNFGDLFLYRCKIDSKIEGAILIPVRTHHGLDILEVIASVELRKALKKNNGSEVSVEVLL